MRRVVGLVALGFSMIAGGQQIMIVDGVSFASDPNTLYVPIKDVGFLLGWQMRSEGKAFFVDDRKVTIPKTLLDGTRLIPISSLRHLGMDAEDVTGTDEVAVRAGFTEFIVRRGDKKVVVNRTTQRLKAYQGDRVVLETHVSTGKRGHATPTGTWSAGPEKSRMRYSRKYDNSPMPWSVQIVGDVFMHGYHSVPKRPASHGCVRVPLRGTNPAKHLWDWIDIGTPITIATAWPDGGATASSSAKKPVPETIPVSTADDRKAGG